MASGFSELMKESTLVAPTNNSKVCISELDYEELVISYANLEVVKRVVVNTKNKFDIVDILCTILDVERAGDDNA